MVIPSSAPPRETAGATPRVRGASLPVPLTSFIGREGEVAAVRQLLGTSRLLTLTGAGGSGKTRLALEVASRMEGEGPGGVVWVELASLHEAELLPNAVATALGLEEGSRPAIEVLLDTLRERSLLLVLDNCEHLVDACARLAEALLRGSPGLRILATSREALGVGGERAWLVPALSLPAGDAAATVAATAQSEAVRLFVERAQAAVATFALTEANVGAVAQICRRLDGLPLAIELAAARVRSLSVEQVAGRLDDAFRLLTTGGRTAVPRHRTLREAIGWSYDLLAGQEQLLLQRLSVFAGDFSLEAAEATCADGRQIEGWEVLDLLAALVDKSLAVMREAGGTARYHLLETIRQYARDRLQAEGGAHAFEARHAAFYAALAAEAEPHFITAERRPWMERLQQELDNVRVALAWTREHDPALHLRLAGTLGWLWYSSGLWTEARRWLEGALALPVAAAPTLDRARALFAAGVLASLQGQAAVSHTWLRESAAIAGEAGERRLEAYALAYVGIALAQEGNPEAEAPTLAALAWFKGAGDLYGHRLAVLVLASLYLVRKELGRAREAAEEGARVAREFGQGRELGIALQVLGTVLLHQGDVDGAEVLFREALDALRRDPQALWVARVLELLGIVACRRSLPLDGARLFGAAEALREAIGAGVLRYDRERRAAHIDAARASAGADAFAAAWAAGRKLTPDEAIAELPPAAPASPAPPAPPGLAPPGPPPDITMHPRRTARITTPLPPGAIHRARSACSPLARWRSTSAERVCRTMRGVRGSRGSCSSTC